MSAATSDRLNIEVYLTEGDLQVTMAEDVRRGLTAPQKYLPAKYFYDAHGSELFEKITELPEYYQTRTELEILQREASHFAERFPSHDIVELGSGSSKKTTTILDAMQHCGVLQRYVPIDVSEQMLRQSSAALLDRYPAMRVDGIVGDFNRHLRAVPPTNGRRMVVFLGSTIGNLNEDERRTFLGGVREILSPQDVFLLGVDLVKDVTTLEAAYNDSAGVTAEFNKNILRVLNRALEGDFEPAAFRHLAFYDQSHARIEMHLVSERQQAVRLKTIDLNLSFVGNETIWTEISCKFTRDSISAALEEAGLKLVEWHTDPRGQFGLLIAARAG